MPKIEVVREATPVTANNKLHETWFSWELDGTCYSYRKEPTFDSVIWNSGGAGFTAFPQFNCPLRGGECIKVTL